MNSTKRKNDETSMPSMKRANTAPNVCTPQEMDRDQDMPMRPTTPPLGMTLSHYDPNTGSYTSSQLNSNHEVKGPICTGMTPVYRAPFERWGSCLI